MGSADTVDVQAVFPAFSAIILASLCPAQGGDIEIMQPFGCVTTKRIFPGQISIHIHVTLYDVKSYSMTVTHICLTVDKS